MPHQSVPSTAARPAAIVVDWGTSTFRAYLIDELGKKIGTVHSSHGASRLEREQFPGFLAAKLDIWIASNPDIPLVMSGMVGSRNGWRETPYVRAPVTFDALARNLVRIEWERPNPAYLVPGVDFKDSAGTYEVMRGEEFQVFGALSLIGTGPPSHTLCLPGTHSKWVDVTGNEIRGFRTHMTGEFFDLLSNQSLLAESINGNAPDAAAFAEGVQYGARPEFSLASSVFTARTRCLSGEFRRDQIHAYLSGLMIGHELASEISRGSTVTSIVLIGSTALCDAYAEAGRELGVEFNVIPAEQATLACAALLRQQLRKS